MVGVDLLWGWFVGAFVVVVAFFVIGVVGSVVDAPVVVWLVCVCVCVFV